MLAIDIVASDGTRITLADIPGIGLYPVGHACQICDRERKELVDREKKIKENNLVDVKQDEQ